MADAAPVISGLHALLPSFMMHAQLYVTRHAWLDPGLLADHGVPALIAVAVSAGSAVPWPRSANTASGEGACTSLRRCHIGPTARRTSGPSPSPRWPSRSRRIDPTRS